MTIRARTTAVVQGIAGSCILVVFAVVLYWLPLKDVTIRTRLHSYANEVRRSSLPLADKERLLDRIEAIDDLLEHSSDIAAWRLAEHDHAISQMLEGGIDPDEVRLIERELQRVEREIKNGMEAEQDER